MSPRSDKIKILLVDDEKLVRDYLKRIIGERNDIIIIGEAADGIEAISKIHEFSPNIILLDIQMPELDGFAVLDSLDSPPPTIFITAYDEYAIQAFEVNAVDYLLKPVTKKRLYEAIDKAKTYIEKETFWKSKAEKILKHVETRGVTNIALNTRRGLKLLSVEEILWIKADGDYTSIHTVDNDFFHKRSLKLLESRLPLHLFLRIHRSYIINLKKVKELTFTTTGGYKLKMTDDSEIPLARRKAREVKRKLKI